MEKAGLKAGAGRGKKEKTSIKLLPEHRNVSVVSEQDYQDRQT